MKIGAVILSRFDSSRLPGKATLEIGHNEPMISWIWLQLRELFDKSDIVVATSKYQEDLPIVSFCQSRDIHYFRGAKHDVLGRLTECAVAHNWDYVLRCNGDSPFVPIKLIQKGLISAQHDQFSIVTNTYKRTFPYGITCQIYKTDFLRFVRTKQLEPETKEHISSISEFAPRSEILSLVSKENLEGIRMTVDYPEDLERIKNLNIPIPSDAGMRWRDYAEMLR